MRRSNSKSGSQTVFWWVAWILLTIGSFFAASYFWTPFIAKRFGSIHETRNSIIWVCAVFGSWMILLIPLIIVMYQKVDRAYEDARIRREKAAQQFRSIYMEKAKRILPSELAAKLASWPETIRGGHLATAILKNGARIPNIFIQNREEILGIYNYSELPFEAKDIADLEPADLARLPSFTAMGWLRLDGAKPE